MIFKKNKNKYFFQGFHKKQDRGFTIVETLVAIFIFSISVISMMLALSRGTEGISSAKQKVIASYLAQEGIEYIRNLRDDYVYKDNKIDDWFSFTNSLKSAGCEESTGCYFDDKNISFSSSQSSQMIDNLSLVSCGGSGTCPPLRYDSTNGKYGYSLGPSSGFVRKINIEFPNEDYTSNTIKIISTVSFTFQGTKTDISFSENLFNLAQPAI